MTTIYKILSYLLLYFVSYFNISFLLNQKTSKLLLLIGIMLTPLLVFIPSELRIICQLLFFILIFFVDNKNLKKIVSATIFHYFISLIIDTLYTILFVTLKIDFSKMNIFINTLIISLISMFLIRRKLFLQLWYVIQNKFETFICAFGAIILGFTYINIGFRYNIINISILIIFILVLIYILLKSFIDSYVIKNETERMIEYIENYEKQINELIVNQHEYKNTLLCIKAMVPKNKKVKEFIDSIFRDESTEDYNILNDIERVRISPIKGLIYHKLLLCKEKEIYSILNVSSGINFNKVNKIGMNTLRDITIVLGVLLDNAIEACLDTEQKSLSIYMYEKNNELIFQISNTFKGTINIELISKVNYSTKGKNRGYGLALAKKKIKDNKKLTLKSEVSNDVFIQSLQVKLGDIYE